MDVDTKVGVTIFVLGVESRNDVRRVVAGVRRKRTRDNLERRGERLNCILLKTGGLLATLANVTGELNFRSAGAGEEARVL